MKIEALLREIYELESVRFQFGDNSQLGFSTYYTLKVSVGDHIHQASSPPRALGSMMYLGTIPQQNRKSLPKYLSRDVECD